MFSSTGNKNTFINNVKDIFDKNLSDLKVIQISIEIWISNSNRWLQKTVKPHKGERKQIIPQKIPSFRNKGAGVITKQKFHARNSKLSVIFLLNHSLRNKKNCGIEFVNGE